MNAACAGFMYAMITGMQFIKAGSAQRVLVIGADTNSRIADPRDRQTYPLFGDGAGAVLLGPSGPGRGALAYTLGADGAGDPMLKLSGGGSRAPLCPASLEEGQQFIRMDGRGVFKWAVRLLAETIRDLVQYAGLTIRDVDLVVLHQANIRIIDAARESLGLPAERFFVNLDRYGNTSAGSIPLALDEAHRQGRIVDGSHVILCGFGAGLAWGAALLKW
jgi:3-oxoacyl-[acyl-carrier-protein] synthase-3